MRKLLAGLFFCLLGVNGLDAQIEVGAVAPEIPKTKWLNTKRPLSLEQLRGRVVVLVFWNAVDTASMLDGTPFVSWWKPLAEPGATFLVVSEDPADVLTPLLEAKGIPLAVAASSTAGQLYGTSKESMVFIVAWDGRIIWRGSPLSDDIREVVEKEVKLAHDLDKTWDPRPMHDDYWDKFVKGCLDDNLKKAAKALEKLMKHKDEDIASHAVGMYVLMFMRVEARVKYAKGIAQHGRAYEAIQLLEESAKIYKGFETADELQTEVGIIKSTKKPVLGWDKKRVQALEKAFKGDRAGALKALTALRSKVKGSKLESLIEQEIGYVESMGVIEKKE